MKIIKKRSITMSFILYFVLLVVVPIITIYLISLSVYQKIIIENARELVDQQQQNVSGTLEKEIRTYNLMLAAITYNTDSIILDQATALHRAENITERYDLTERMDQRIELLMHAGENIDGLYFIYTDESYYYYNNPLLKELEAIRQLNVYKAALLDENKTKKGDIVTDITTDSNGRYTLLFAVHPVLGVYRNDVEVVMLSAYTDVVDDHLYSKENNKLGKMLIVNEEGMVMYSYNKDHEGANINQIEDLSFALLNNEEFYRNKSDGNTYMVNSFKMESVDWKIINLVDKKEITGQADQVIIIGLYMILAMIALFLLFSIFFFRGLIRPINDLIIGMKNIEKEQLDSRVTISGNKEISHLSISFNAMANRIESLVNENKIKESQKVRAEVEALQSQINPHFIVNVLTSIRFMALMSKNEGIKNMSERLMQILNASFRDSRRFARVEDELELVKSYVYIMQIRYGNSFDVTYSIDESLLKEKMLKLILQPIVENSITHGLSEKEGQGNLSIKVYRSGADICIEVMDDGVGINPDVVNHILEINHMDKDEKTHIGLANVHWRIVLHHGESYGLKIESQRGSYAKIIYRLPVIAYEEEDLI